MIKREKFDALFDAADKEHIKIQDKLIEQLYEIDHVSKPDKSLIKDWERYLHAAHLYFSRRNQMPLEERSSYQHSIVAARCILQGMIDELSQPTLVLPMPSQTKH